MRVPGLRGHAACGTRFRVLVEAGHVSYNKNLKKKLTSHPRLFLKVIPPGLFIEEGIRPWLGCGRSHLTLSPPGPPKQALALPGGGGTPLRALGLFGGLRLLEEMDESDQVRLQKNAPQHSGAQRN